MRKGRGGVPREQGDGFGRHDRATQGLDCRPHERFVLGRFGSSSDITLGWTWAGVPGGSVGCDDTAFRTGEEGLGINGEGVQAFF